MSAAKLYECSGRATFPWRPARFFTAEDFIDFARNEEVYLAIHQGAIAGVATLFRPLSFLHCLFVDPERRRAGIGRALLDHVRGIADAPLTLKVDAPNAAAIAFYERMGGVMMDGPDHSGVDEGVDWRRWRIG